MLPLRGVGDLEFAEGNARFLLEPLGALGGPHDDELTGHSDLRDPGRFQNQASDVRRKLFLGDYGVHLAPLSGRVNVARSTTISLSIVTRRRSPGHAQCGPSHHAKSHLATHSEGWYRRGLCADEATGRRRLSEDRLCRSLRKAYATP